MEEIEVPTEHLHETIQERAEEAKESKWLMGVAISTALMAVFAALASLFAGHHSNEALIEQIKSSDQWAYYQAKGIKAEIASLKENKEEATAFFEKYKKEQEEIKKEAEAATKTSEEHLLRHLVIAKAVTLFQIAIAISAIAVLTRKKFLWIGSILIAAIGLIFFVSGLM